MWELGQNSKCYYIVFDELTDIPMYFYVEVDFTKIHQYLTRLYFGAQIGGGWGWGGHQVFSSLEGGTENFFKQLGGEQMFFQHMSPFPGNI